MGGNVLVFNRQPCAPAKIAGDFVDMNNYGSITDGIQSHEWYEGKGPIKDIYSTGSAFAALHENGSITSWGNKWYGGIGAPNMMAIPIYSNSHSFAALKLTIAAWGEEKHGFAGGQLEFPEQCRTETKRDRG